MERTRADADFEQFAEAHVGRLLQTARVLTGSEADAEDLVQETLWKTYLKWGRVARAEDPAAYVSRILINQFLTMKRRRSPITKLVSLGHVSRQTDVVADQYRQIDDRRGLVAALGQLPPGQRTAVVLKYLLDMSGREMATAMGVREATARAQLSRGLMALRELLSSMNEKEVS